MSDFEINKNSFQFGASGSKINHPPVWSYSITDLNVGENFTYLNVFGGRGRKKVLSKLMEKNPNG